MESPLTENRKNIPEIPVYSRETLTPEGVLTLHRNIIELATILSPMVMLLDLLPLEPERWQYSLKAIYRKIRELNKLLAETAAECVTGEELSDEKKDEIIKRVLDIRDETQRARDQR